MDDICNRLDEDPSLKTRDIVTGNAFVFVANVQFTAPVSTGKGMPYLPSAASLAAAHKGKIKNIHSNEMKEENNPGIVILKFEVHEILAYDKEQIKRFGQTGMHHILYMYIQ